MDKATNADEEIEEKTAEARTMNRTPETIKEKIQKIEDAFRNALREQYPNGIVNVSPVPNVDEYLIGLWAEDDPRTKIGSIELAGFAEWDMAKDKRELARTKVRALLLTTRLR